MQDPRKANKSFDDNGLQFVWDSTSIKLAETCSRKYYYQMIEGWQPKDLSVHLRFGQHYATALEHYYKHRALGHSSADALDLVLQEALEATWEAPREYRLIEQIEDDTNSGWLEDEDRPGYLYRELPAGPWDSGHNLKTRETLIRTIVWYVDQFEDEQIEVIKLGDGSPAVEHSFTLEADDGIIFSGHLDRLVTYGTHPYVMDQKAQPLTTKVLTPTGWKMIKNLAVGDLVIGQAGHPIEVVNIFPKGITPVYKFTFNDNTSVLCGLDHLWTVTDQFNRTDTLTVAELLAAPQWKKYSIPLCEPVQHPTADLPLDPFVLGLLLGDGYLAGNSIQLSTTKDYLIDIIAPRVGGDSIKKASQYNHSWTISGGHTLAAIKALGLFKTKAATKFIPPQYLIASEAQRRQLLLGLLTSDGGWNGNSRIYDSTSEQLIQDLCQLVRSLGGQARYRDRRDTAFRASLRMVDWPTGLGRRYITNIERVEDQETACIQVSASDGLYVTENYIVTHNTTGGNTSAYYFKQFDTDTQMSMYTFAGKAIFGIPIKGVIIDAVQVAVGFSRYERGFTFRTDAQLSEWYEDTMDTITRLRHQTMEQYFPMNRASCGNYGGCPFREVCSRDPSVRENFLKADFVRGPTWDPLTRR